MYRVQEEIKAFNNLFNKLYEERDYKYIYIGVFDIIDTR